MTEPKDPSNERKAGGETSKPAFEAESEGKAEPAAAARSGAPSSDDDEARAGAGDVETEVDADTKRSPGENEGDPAADEGADDEEAGGDEEDERDSEPGDEEEAEGDDEEEEETYWQYWLRLYATADPRSIGLFRIALGLLLFEDVARRWPDLAMHYANTGWLTNHYAIFRPMSGYLFSVYHAMSSLGEVKFLVILHLLVNFFLIIGWHSKVMHVLAFVLLTSMNSRNIMLENGGFVVLALLALWGIFLPTHRRYSVDAWLASWRARREGTAVALNDASFPVADTRPVISLAVAVLVLQWTLIYYFNVVHKTGSTWRNGTAVYYFFQQDRMLTLFGGWVRHFFPLILYKLMTFGALIIESLIALLIISPIGTSRARMIAWLLSIVLHGTFTAVVQLGPFSWAMCTVYFVFIPTSFWEWFEQRLLAKSRPCLVRFDPESGLGLSACRILKRMSLLGELRFEAAEVAGGPAPLLSVWTDGGEQRLRGHEAVKRVASCLRWAGRFIGWPVVRHLLLAIGRPIAKRRKRWSRFFEVEDLPGTDTPLPVESPSTLALARSKYWAAHALMGVLVVAETSQVLMENRAVPQWLKPKTRPQWMEAIVVYPRLFQGWTMFAPEPPTDDGRVVCEGFTADGRTIDPLNEEEPTNFDLNPKYGFRKNQLWGEFQRRIYEDRFSTYWAGVREYLRHHHELVGRPQDALVGFTVWHLTERLPPYGNPPLPSDKHRLFSWGRTSPVKPGERLSTPRKPPRKRPPARSMPRRPPRSAAVRKPDAKRP